MTMPSFDNLSRGDKVSAYTGTVEQIEKALEAVGVECLENDGAACGVRFRRQLARAIANEQFNIAGPSGRG